MTLRRLARPPRMLRHRLVLMLVSMIAVASIVIGVVGVLALQGYLYGRLDTQLASSTQRSQGAFGDRGSTVPAFGDALGPVGSVLFAPGQSASDGTLAALVTDGKITEAGYLVSGGANAKIKILGAARVDALISVPDDDEPHTVTVAGLGAYRVIAHTTTSGQTLVVGLSLSGVRSTVAQLVWVSALVALLLIALSIVLGTVVVRLALRPLDRVAATARRVSELPLERGEVELAERIAVEDAKPGTEVGEVGLAVNRMLGNVESALAARQESENKVRQFVADASHELRTPLASIRGYSELTRRMNAELPEDARHALGRIESESVRMTSLVEDLLLLARLDEGRDVEIADVDLSRILLDTVSDAQTVARDHLWGLDLPEEPVEIRGDEPRLRQVIANLLANARVHTPAGTHVDVALGLEPGFATVTVTDDGPGIQPQIADTLFERFARADVSRSRVAGSTGLGLAIVRAIVEAHDGTVSVESEPGRTRFAVRLPRSA